MNSADPLLIWIDSITKSSAYIRQGTDLSIKVGGLLSSVKILGRSLTNILNKSGLSVSPC